MKTFISFQRKEIDGSDDMQATWCLFLLLALLTMLGQIRANKSDICSDFIRLQNSTISDNDKTSTETSFCMFAYQYSDTLFRIGMEKGHFLFPQNWKNETFSQRKIIRVSTFTMV